MPMSGQPICICATRYTYAETVGVSYRFLASLFKEKCAVDKIQILNLQWALFISDEAIYVLTSIRVINYFICMLQMSHICVTFGHVSMRGQSI